MPFPGKSRHSKSLCTFVSILLSGFVAEVYGVCDVGARKKVVHPVIDLSFTKYSNSKVHTAEIYDIEERTYSFIFQSNSWSVVHDYTVLTYPERNNSTPITNGHLHYISVGYAVGENFNGGDGYQLLISPTLSVSSNQLRNSEELDSGSYRLDGHLVWWRTLNSLTDIFVGFCASALTGEYQLLPYLALNYSIPNWRLLLGYPKAELVYQPLPKVLLISTLGLSGRQWQVLDKNLENRSDLHLAGKKFSLAFQYQAHTSGQVSLAWMYDFQRKMKYFTKAHNWVSADIQDSRAWILEYKYSFD